jgi:prepilin-type N-terminal cleavage/methylation domain-containing protein
VSAPSPTDDGGFTLVELLVTMLIATVVLFAALRGGELFASTQRTASDRIAAQDAARSTMRQIVTSLRQARLPAGQRSPLAPGVAPTARDVAVAGWIAGPSDPSSGSTAGWLRYCASADDRSLLIGVRAGDGWAAPGACVAGTTADGWHHAPLLDGTLRDAATLFAPDSGACVGGLAVGSAGLPCTPDAASTTTLGVRVSVAPTTTSPRSAAALSVAVALRNGLRS